MPLIWSLLRIRVSSMFICEDMDLSDLRSSSATVPRKTQCRANGICMRRIIVVALVSPESDLLHGRTPDYQPASRRVRSWRNW